MIISFTIFYQDLRPTSYPKPFSTSWVHKAAQCTLDPILFN